MPSPFDNLTNYPHLPASLKVDGGGWTVPYVCVAHDGNFIQATTGDVRLFTGPDAPVNDFDGIVLRDTDAPVKLMGFTVVRFRVADASRSAVISSARVYHP